MNVISADGIVRAESSPFAKACPDEMKKYTSTYFSRNIHESLPGFIASKSVYPISIMI